MFLYDLILLGLLTVVYGTSNLCDTNGAPVAVGPNEVAIFAGLALARATTTSTTAATATINGNDIATVPSAFHSVSASMHDKQHSLVFRCRGNKDALLPSTGVVSSSAGASSSNSSSSSSSITLAEFYEQFKLSHRSVNEEIPPASNAATATTTATTTPATATATTATTTDANGATATAATAATATAVYFPIAAPDPPPDISVAPIRVITVLVIDQGLNVIFFKIHETTRINRIKEAYSARMGIPMESFRFMFEGQRLYECDDYTAKTYEMEDGDQIEVCLEIKGD
jgi:small ubiquitin-related modifier